MRNSLIQLAVLSALGTASMQLFAAPPAGFKVLPAAGTVVPASLNQPAGTTAYVTCNPTGNFGSSFATTPAGAQPTNSSECLIARRSPSVITQPPITATGYALTPVASALRPLTMSNAYTGGVAKNIGSVFDIVWRKPAATAPVTATDECIYGTQVLLNGTDYNVLATGNQYFEVNDIARGGFGTRPVAIAYVPTQGNNVAPIYRAGRTFTSVQHRASPLWNGLAGYVNLPLTTPAFTGSINGLDDTTASPTALGTASSAQQTASLNTNWVTLTTRLNGSFKDIFITSISNWTYIHSTCNAQPPLEAPNAIRVRQTFQVRSIDSTNTPVNQQFIEVSTAGFVPPGGVTTPLPMNPF